MPPEAQLRLAALLFSSRPYERNRLPSASTPSPLCLAGGTQGSAQDAAWQGDVEGLLRHGLAFLRGFWGLPRGFLPSCGCSSAPCCLSVRCPLALSLLPSLRVSLDGLFMSPQWHDRAKSDLGQFVCSWNDANRFYVKRKDLVKTGI